MAIALRYAARLGRRAGTEVRTRTRGMPVRTCSSSPTAWAATPRATSPARSSSASWPGWTATATAPMTRCLLWRRRCATANTSLRQAMENHPSCAGMGTHVTACCAPATRSPWPTSATPAPTCCATGSSARSPRTTPSSRAWSTRAGSRPEEAEDHPQRSLVTRVLTGQRDDEPDLSMREAARRRPLPALLRRPLRLRRAATPSRRSSPRRRTRAPPPTGSIEVALRAERPRQRDRASSPTSSTCATPRRPAPPRRSSARRRCATARASAPVAYRSAPAEKAASLARVGAARRPRTTTTSPVAGRGAALQARHLDPPRRPRLRPRPDPGRRRVRGLRLDPEPVLRRSPSDGYVAIWQGVGQNIGPVNLSRVYLVTDVPVGQLPTYVQDVVSTGTPLGSLADADTRVETLRTSATDCRAQATAGIPCGQNPVVAPTPSTTSTTVPASPTDTATHAESPASRRARRHEDHRRDDHAAHPSRRRAAAHRLRRRHHAAGLDQRRPRRPRGRPRAAARPSAAACSVLALAFHLVRPLARRLRRPADAADRHAAQRARAW